MEKVESCEKDRWIYQLSPALEEWVTWSLVYIFNLFPNLVFYLKVATFTCLSSFLKTEFRWSFLKKFVPFRSVFPGISPFLTLPWKSQILVQ